jgi:hypothetical protein
MKKSSAVLGLMFALVVFSLPHRNFAAISQTECVALNFNLKIGARDAPALGEVTKLQKYLQASGILDHQPTGNFGSLTLQAVKNFQRGAHISPTGTVGPQTRAYLKTLTCSVTPPPTPVTPGCPAHAIFNYLTGARCDMPPELHPGCPAGALFNYMNGARCELESLQGITVTSPNGGERLVKGSTYRIKWNSNGAPNVNITLRHGNVTPNDSSGIIATNIVNQGYYDWIVPENLAPADYYYIGVWHSTNGFGDLSDAAFSILAASTTPQDSFAISASAGPGGSISPAGIVSVSRGNGQTFLITADARYQIANVVVDGASQGAQTSYTFSNVAAAHSISVTFAQTSEIHISLATMPTSDSWYGAVVNANNYIGGYVSFLGTKIKLVTDMFGSSADTFSTAYTTVTTALPNILIGSYHSSRDAQAANTLTNYPPRAVPKENLSNSQIVMVEPGYPDAYVVDYTQTAARTYLVDTIVRDAVSVGKPLIYLDNVSHSEMGFVIPWNTTTDLVKELVTKLHAQGIRVIINAAWAPGLTSMDSVDALIATGVDGISLEMAFINNIRNDTQKINLAMQQYRKMLDAGLTIVFVPLGSATGGADSLENIEIEQRLQAGYGLMFRKPGDRLFISQLFFKQPPEWTEWPEKFGAPLGDATFVTNEQSQIVMTRRFTNYTLTVNIATKEVTTTPAS